MRTNHRHYILLILALGAIVFSILGYYLFHRTILSKAIESSKIMSEATSIDENNQRRQNVASIYTKSREERAKFNSFLVSEDKIVNLIEEIEKIGTDTSSSIELSAITSGDVSTKNGITSSHFKAHVEGHGPWTNMMRALILIENMPYSVSINNIRLTQSSNPSLLGLPTKEVSKTKQWQLSLDIKILTTK